MYVSNVVPQGEKQELSIEQYNAVLQDFHDHILTAARGKFTIGILMV